jgi:IclR family acetate operon transcriptional repressor
VLIERLDGNQPVRTFHSLGVRTPILATANGKATLAQLSPDVVEALIRQGLTRYTDRTIVDEAEMLAEIDDVRRRGYAVNRGETEPDVAAVAAAIVVDGEPVGSMSISMPRHRLTDDVVERFAPLIVDTARVVGQTLSPP